MGGSTPYSDMNKFLSCFFIALFITATSYAQPNLINSSNDDLRKMLKNIAENPLITGDSTYNILTTWNTYPPVQQTGKEYLYILKDSIFGEVPFKIFVPKAYKNTIPSPLVLLLHGAVGQSHFEHAYKATQKGDDIFFDYLSEKNIIIVRPFADPSKKFNWVVNKQRLETNPTYTTLTNAISNLKEFLNIDDNKVFAYGHSDGADGAFALDVYKPSQFAGFVCYNSMFTNIFASDIYLENTKNRKLYVVHSDLDDLRPIQQTRLITHVLDSMHVPMEYKEYAGYQHYDKHLEKDLPNSNAFLMAAERQPFAKHIDWQTSNSNNASCDWLCISGFNVSLDKAYWHTDINVPTYDKNKGTYMDYLYYHNNPSAAAYASYSNNIFEIASSRATELEVRVNPSMINTAKQISINVNGSNVYKGTVEFDKNYLLTQFHSSFDRKALWMKAIKVKP